MKVKTAESTGRTLDRMVMIALGYTYQKGLPEGEWARQETCKAGLWRGFGGSNWSCLTCIGDDRPSTDPAATWPLIDEKCIDLYHVRQADLSVVWWADMNSGAGPEYSGPTTLIAACRCFVASELGEEVDIPEELL